VPEGDSLRRAAGRLSVLEGEVVAVETPHPRAAALGLAEKLDGHRLERVEAVGKHLLLGFEGGLVLRSHLRMRGRWRVLDASATPSGRPWLVLRGSSLQAVLWHGPVLELGKGRPAAVTRLGPDVLDDPPDLDGIVRRLRAAGQGREVGEALLDQSLVAGIGNMWRAEALHEARVSPWRTLRELSDDDLRVVLVAAAELMRAPRARRRAYRRASRPCGRCGTPIASRPQGDDARIAYWCPTCQGGTRGAGA
jgi:endonuclease-8